MIACGPSGKNAAQNVVVTAAAFYAFVNGSNFDEDDGDAYDDGDQEQRDAGESAPEYRRPYTLRDLRRRG